ncbi:MAG: sigma-54 interaction domain-containing protein [Bdellovibrionales bacterium]
MVKWDEFEHIHVIKKLKNIVGSWWNVDVFFTNEMGQLTISDFEKLTAHNPITPSLFQKEALSQSFQETVSKCIDDLKLTDNRYSVRKWDAVGFDLIVFPIVIENDFMGTVVASGFLKDNANGALVDVREKLSAFGFSTDMIEKSVSKISHINDQDREHFVELIELVGQEIITLHLEITSRENRINELNKELGSRYKYDKMIGKSKPMQQLYNLLDKIKQSETTVLINGSNGTGKELIAKSIHYNSPRSKGTFIIQNCSAFNDNLLESELFGHAKGSFTGAVKDKKGLFEMAHKGTFFLDEIGDTSPQMQVKLLRVLQEGTFTPVGATAQKTVDVRILAATNKDLKKMVEEGTFREDLYYRLNVINIKVPSLKDRKEDIPLLAESFMNEANKKDGGKKVLTKRALEKLYDYAWPGNVRELKNEIERLLVLSGPEQKITHDMLSAKILESSKSSSVQGSRVHGKLKDALEELEKEMIREGLRRTGWNKSRLAKELGISRAGLIMKVDKYNLEKRKIAK